MMFKPLIGVDGKHLLQLKIRISLKRTGREEIMEAWRSETASLP